MSLTDVTRVDIERFRRDLLFTDIAVTPLLRKGADSASSTIRYAIASALRFLTWAMERDDTEPLLTLPKRRMLNRRIPHLRLTREDLLSFNDLLPRQKRVLPKFLTQFQLDICRTWIMDTYAFNVRLQLRNRAVFEAMWDGALRRGSLLGLRSENIDWLERTILVSFDEKDYRDAWYRKSSNRRTAKTGEYMVIVADQTLQWLDRYRQDARPTEAVRVGHGIFFCEQDGSDHGQPLSFQTLKYFFELMSKPEDQGGAGIYVTPHMLRHTWATMAEDDGLPTETIQHQLGHAHIATTEIYSHVSPEKRRQDMKQWRERHPERYTGVIQ
jgi:integrase